nr:response regulator [Sulfurovaceae bacterium]
MKIIIVENELYLAQSISSKLGEKGFEVETFSSIREALNSKGDVYLISTNLPGQNCHPLITEFRDKIIILMVSYINNDTVSKPIQLGAKDYIVKPFMIEELIRKIEHYKDYQELKQQNRLYTEYTSNLLRDISVDFNINKLVLPIVIFTNYPKLIDKIVFSYVQKTKRVLNFIPLTDKNWKDKIRNASIDSVLYISDLQILKKSEREHLFEIIENLEFIISTTSKID